MSTSLPYIQGKIPMEIRTICKEHLRTDQISLSSFRLHTVHNLLQRAIHIVTFRFRALQCKSMGWIVWGGRVWVRKSDTHGYIQRFWELYSANLWDELFGDEEYELYTWLHSDVFRALQCKFVGSNVLGRRVYELTSWMEQVGKTMPELYSLTSAATASRSVVLNKNYCI